MADRVELYRDSTGEWRWRRQSENGRVVSTSGDGYKNYGDAEQIAQDVNQGEVYFVTQDELPYPKDDEQ